MKIKLNKHSYVFSDFSLILFNDYLLSFILEANLFFCLIKHDSFCKLLLLCWSNMQISHWIFLKTTFIKWYSVMKKKLLYDLLSSCKLSLILNCWTNFNNHAFLAITDYFIMNNWNYVETLLMFKSLSNIHSEKK